MRLLMSCVAAAAIAAGALALGGCESNPTTAPAGEPSAYAGGTGVFGEDPVNPGEHSRERFVDSAQLHPDAARR